MIDPETNQRVDMSQSVNFTVDDTDMPGIAGFANKEEIKKLRVYPKIGKCPSWSRSERDGILNGELPESELKTLKRHSNHKLSIKAADDFDKMEDKYFSETGKKFILTDSYRDYDGQWKLFDFDHCQKTGLFRKVEDLETQVAPPGTSNHGWGMAVDLGPTEARDWIRTNGSTWDWWWGEVPSESWHFTYNLR
jgi:hypothetical protein